MLNEGPGTVDNYKKHKIKLSYTPPALKYPFIFYHYIVLLIIFTAVLFIGIMFILNTAVKKRTIFYIVKYKC